MKYEAPYMEVVRFTFKNAILTASESGNGAEDTNYANSEETEPPYDPFA